MLKKAKMGSNIFTQWPLWLKISVPIVCICFLLFLIIWVVLPLIFMNSISFQRFIIFRNWQDPSNPEFDNPKKYGLEGVVNFYLTVKDMDNSTNLNIGAWSILPENDIKTTPIKSHDNQTAEIIIKNTSYPIIIYLHGVGSNRIKYPHKYEVLRKHFMIISLDHRGYGDSSPGVPPSEMGMVSDTWQIFKWIRSKTNNDIYFWGYSLGTALSTHTLRRLKEEDSIVPTGLILEASFTTMQEEIPFYLMGFSWMPWFEATIQRPLKENGFLFETATNILYVDCPIMILHAEDDPVIPYSLAQKVVEIATTRRTIPLQGNVTYHQFGRLGYGHEGITNDPNIPQDIVDFIGMCEDQKKRRG